MLSTHARRKNGASVATPASPPPFLPSPKSKCALFGGHPVTLLICVGLTSFPLPFRGPNYRIADPWLPATGRRAAPVSGSGDGVRVGRCPSGQAAAGEGRAGASPLRRDFGRASPGPFHASQGRCGTARGEGRGDLRLHTFSRKTPLPLQQCGGFQKVALKELDRVAAKHLLLNSRYTYPTSFS